MNSIHALYRFFDAEADLLYVGISINPGYRFSQHRDDKPWWTEVSDIKIEPFADRRSVMDAERAAIIAEQPRYNVVHNRRRVTTLIRCSACGSGVRDDGYAIGMDHPAIACVTCLRGERRHDIHAAAYPDCDATWHDAWDHGFLVRGDSEDLAAHLAAMSMPDDCNHCSSAGVQGLYLPHKWSGGVASYRCMAKHHWTRGWRTEQEPGQQRMNMAINFASHIREHRVAYIHFYPEFALGYDFGHEDEL